jgi:hypothetical protein
MILIVTSNNDIIFIIQFSFIFFIRWERSGVLIVGMKVGVGTILGEVFLGLFLGWKFVILGFLLLFKCMFIYLNEIIEFDLSSTML